MKVLVTGGAGFLGINLVRHFLAGGHEVRSLDLVPFDYPEAVRVSVLHGDVRDPDILARACAGVDVVVHCAAALSPCTPDDIASTEVKGTYRLLSAALDGGVSRVINISSVAVYGPPDHRALSEDDLLRGRGAFAQAKVQAEAICAEFRAAGLCVPVLRPQPIVGPERLGAFELLYDFAFSGRNFPILGAGANLCQLLDVEDLCQAVELCATGDREAVNDVFNLGAERYGPLRETFQGVLDRAGHGKRVIGLPHDMTLKVLHGLERLGPSPLYAWVHETGDADSFVSTGKISARLGFVPRYSAGEALIRNYEWYALNRSGIPRRAGVTHRARWRKGAALSLARLVF